MMGLTASLDIGSEKMVMAVAGTDNRDECRLAGIKMIALQGMKNGVITDRAKVKSYIQYLLKELSGGKPVDRINIVLSGDVLRVSEHRVNVPVQKKVVKQGDINRAEAKCADLVTSKGDEVVDLVPIAYAIDRGNYISNPIGHPGRTLDVRYRTYVANSEYLLDIRNMLAESGVDEVNFFPLVRAYMEALDIYNSEEAFALIDLGAAHTGVMLFYDGMLMHETMLPLGARTIENDIAAAFRIEDIQVAKKMKHTHAAALRSACKSEKVEIPEMKKQIEKRDLAKVVQCRLEELLEGVVYQLQQWRFNDPDNKIFMTGGGSRIADTNVLLEKLSGHKVAPAKAKGIQTTNGDILEAPACLAALGLLRCEHVEPEEEKGGLGDWFSSIFK